MIACLSGAAVETALSGSYNICQFFNLEWGKSQRAKAVPQYYGSVDRNVRAGARDRRHRGASLQLVNISVVFGMVIMPLTYYPILRVAADKNIQGKHANSLSDNVAGIGGSGSDRHGRGGRRFRS